MNNSTRTVIALCFALFSIILALNRCHQQTVKQYRIEHTWTPELEQQMRDVFYTQISKENVDESAKQAYVECCFSSFKELFPNGLSDLKPETMSDSTKIAVMHIGAKCAPKLISQTEVWQPELLQQLKLQFYSYPEVKLLPAAAKPEYVDCLTFKIKTQFPQGLSKAGKDSVKKAIEKARKGCLVLVSNKYKKQQQPDTLSRK